MDHQGLAVALSITPADASEHPRIEALAREIWREHYARILSEAQIDYMLEAMYAPSALANDAAHGVHFELLEVAGVAVGFIGYGPVEAHVCKLHKLYLRAACRGQGYGQQALRHVERRALALGAHTLRLNVNKHNTLAQRAYERAGMRRAHAEVVAIGGGFVMDDYIYEKRLL